MSTGSRTSFQKRQKELQRTEKQREKSAKRLARRQASKTGGGLDAEIANPEGLEGGNPEGAEAQPDNPAVPNSPVPE